MDASKGALSIRVCPARNQRSSGSIMGDRGGKMEEFSISRYLEGTKATLDRLPLNRVEKICEVIYQAYLDGRTLFIFGNGGSAALASHLACDLGKGTHHPGPSGMSGVKRLKVVSLADSIPMITAWSNDSSYEDVFAEQMRNFIQAGDVAFGVSGSGNSPNVLKALELAREVGATTVGITGFQGGKMSALLDWGIVVPADNMQQIEDAHLVLAHMIFLELRRRLQALANKK
jgi:D-sedoheptulose 7-phosphate isomerase